MNELAMPPKPTNKIVLKRRRQSAPLSTYLRDTSLASLWSGCLTVQLACQLCLLTALKPHPLLSNLYPLHSSCPACGAVIGVSWVQCTRSHPASNRRTLQNSRCFVGVATKCSVGGRVLPALGWDTTREVKMRAAAAERRCGRERPGSAN